MVATEAQKRASKKWNQNNKEKHTQIKNNWIEKNRDRVNEQTAKRQLSYYYAKKAVSYEWAVKELFKMKI
jgi:hypothetical protein